MSELAPITYTFRADEFGATTRTVVGLSIADMSRSLVRIRTAHSADHDYSETVDPNTGTITVSTGFGLWKWTPETSFYLTSEASPAVRVYAGSTIASARIRLMHAQHNNRMARYFITTEEN